MLAPATQPPVAPGATEPPSSTGLRTEAAAAALRAERAEELAREGLWSKAAAALTDGGVAEPSGSVRAELDALHPVRQGSVDTSEATGSPPRSDP